jgi:sugar lactone lactonase YvrE
MHYVRFKHFLAIGLLSFAATLAAQNLPVLTAQYDNARTNANNNEVLLNPTNVNSSTFGKVGFWTLDADAAAQPLYVPGVQVGTSTVNALYVATMNNSVYALDADHPGSAPLWHINLGPTVPTGYQGKCPAGFAIGSQQLGILSTPVIDNASGTIYVVATNPVASQPAYGFTLYALDLGTGRQKNGGSIPISASVPGTGSASVNGTVSMGQINMLQRPGLLLSQGNVYIGFGSCGYDISPFHGWVLGYNAGNIQQQTSVFNTTPNGDAGGVWQSGEGLVADPHGSIYFEVGNGDTDEQANFGESFVKLSPAGALQDYFTPSNFHMLSALDEDLSSTAPLLTPDTNLLIGSSKQGLIYVLNAASMGGVGNFVQTFFGDTECDPMTYSQCNKVHSLAYWQALGESRLYVWASGDNQRAYAYNNGQFNTTPESQNPTTAGYPGGMLAVSSAGGIPSTGIVWALAPAVLHAYQATNVANELWNSNQNPQRDALVGGYHFSQPTIVNGKVFVPDGQNTLVVYGQLGTSTVTVAPRPAVISSGSLTPFQSRSVGTMSGVMNVRVRLNRSLALRSVSVAPGFTEFSAGAVSGCIVDGQTINPGLTVCTVSVTFQPKYPGLRTAPLIFTDSTGAQYSLGLTGTGLAPQAALTPGITTSVAGGGSSLGDGGPAVSATLNGPSSVAIDNAGNYYISDSGNNRVRKVGTNGIITTYAGTGLAGYGGDGGPATGATIVPGAIALDAAGNLYIVDGNNIRRVDVNGTIATIAGTSQPGFSGDGGPAVNAQLNQPLGLTVDSAGNIYVADTSNFRVRKIDPSGNITTVAGNGIPGSTGDGGAATSAGLADPAGVAVDSLGNIYIADGRVRKVNTSGTITTIAGTSQPGFSGDGGLAVKAQLNAAQGVAVDAGNNVYVTDAVVTAGATNNRIRRINASGSICTVAGNGVFLNTGGYNTPATQTPIAPSSVALDSAGNLYIADYAVNQIVRVNVSQSVAPFASYTAGTTSPSRRIVVTDIGNQHLSLGGLNITGPFNFLGDPNPSYCSNTPNLGVGFTCAMAITFTPPGVGTFTGTATVTDNSLNLTGTTQAVSLSGTGVSP